MLPLAIRPRRGRMKASSPSTTHRGDFMSANRRPSRIALALVCLLSANRVSAVEPPREPILTLKGHTGGVFHVAYSLDGKMMATSSKDHTARLWDAATGNLLFTLSGHRQS